jgi:hypothetical protein
MTAVRAAPIAFIDAASIADEGARLEHGPAVA